MNYILPILSYQYNALEPFFDEETMRIHHTKHHQTYINNTNIILKNLNEFNNLPIETLIKQLTKIPQKEQQIIRNNAGGHINHTLFWKLLKKNTILEGTLKKLIEDNFNDTNSFKEKFEKCAMNKFGSGWVWLVKEYDNKLHIISTSNQDNPLMGEKITGKIYSYPILGLDLWEHAYYLKYQNRKLDYIKAFWNIINWEEASNRIHHNF